MQTPEIVFRVWSDIQNDCSLKITFCKSQCSAVPDTHQFEMQWTELSLPLGIHRLLHPLAKTLLICY